MSLNENVGRIFVDTSTEELRAYAVGRTGFIDMTTGDFLRYDSAFAPDMFSHEPFQEILPRN